MVLMCDDQHLAHSRFDQRKQQERKRDYSGFNLKEAMPLISTEEFIRWKLNALERPPSDYFKENLRRLESFDLEHSELAKTILINDLLSEVVHNHPKLKVWESAPFLCQSYLVPWIKFAFIFGGFPY